MKIFISAGEPSGDLYGALIAKELKRYADISGIGGELMRKAGVKLIRTIEGLSILGFNEGLLSYPRVKGIFNEILHYLYKNPPDILIPIAFSEFHLFLLRRLPSIKTYYLAPPQLWAWGKWRKYFLKGKVDKIICILPFEQEFFAKMGIDAVYFGNPLVDYVKAKKPKIEILKDYRLGSDTRILTLMPGSRKEEIHHHLPLMLEIFNRLRRDIPDIAGFVIMKDRISSDNRLIYTDKDKYDIMASSDLILLASGTACLEATILNVPFVSIYRLSPISWILGKILVKLKWFSLPNIILSKDVVPEYIQPQFKPLYSLILDLLESPIKRERIRQDLNRVRRLLGPKGAVKRIAEFITRVSPV